MQNVSDSALGHVDMNRHVLFIFFSFRVFGAYLGMHSSAQWMQSRQMRRGNEGRDKRVQWDGTEGLWESSSERGIYAMV